MTQVSRPQSDNLSAYPFPSDPGPYSGDAWAGLFRILFTGDQQVTQGPFVRYLNELEVTDNASTTVYVDTGAGMVNGHALISSEQETWTVPAGPAGGRTDRVVMVENNTNVEVTQSTAARPLLFPADLSEYTATPGVPAYSARLAILRGNDAGALPALDQTNALYMVELARYDINNVPTISAATDYREFCYFASTIGTRRFLVAPTRCFQVAPYAECWNPAADPNDILHGPVMKDTKNTYVMGEYVIPTDYRANMTQTAVVRSRGTGNVYGINNAYFGECGEDYDDTSLSTGSVATAVGAPVFTNDCIQTLNVTGITTDDIVLCRYWRQGGDVLDTVGDNVYFAGWIIEYEALS